MVEEIKKSPTEETFSKYRVGLKTEIDKAKANKSLTEKGFRGASRSRRVKKYLFKKSKAALREYEGLLNNVVTLAHQDATEINANVNGYVEQSKAIQAAFDAVIQSLRSAKQTLGDVETIGYALAELVENSDQSEESKWLRNDRNVPNFENRLKKITGESKEGKQGYADRTNDLADDAFEIAVKVVGINASIHVESLTPLSTSLLTGLTALKTDVEANMVFAQTEKTANQTELSKQNQSQSTSRMDDIRADLIYAGLINTDGFVGDHDCLTGSDLAKKTRAELERIANKVEKSYK